MARREIPIGRSSLRQGAISSHGRKTAAILPWYFDHHDAGHALKRLEQVYLDTIDAIDQFSGRLQELNRDENLSSVGRRSAAFNYAIANIAPALKRGRLEVQAARNDLRALREKLTMPTVDKTDIAGALMRDRIRQRIEAMDVSDRVMIGVGAPGDTIEPMVALAVAEAPAFMSGMTEQNRQAVINRFMTETHGSAAMEEIQELVDAIDQVDRTIEAARNVIVEDACDGEPERFDTAVRDEIAKSVIWLRRRSDGVKVVDLDARHERPATADELRSGQFFETFEDYESAQNAIS